MATLFNTKISATYEGLFKTIDNAAITASLKELTDGSGNQSGLYVNTAGDFKVSNILEWGSLKDTGTGVTITRYVTSTDGIENFDNNTSLPTSAAVKLYVDSKFATSDTLEEVLSFGNTTGANNIVIQKSIQLPTTTTNNGTPTDVGVISFGGTFSNGNRIFNDSSGGNLRIQGTDNLQLFAPNHKISNVNGSLIIAGDTGVKLYYQNSQKLQTTTSGIDVTGNLVVSGTITGAGGSFLPLAGGTMTGNTLHGDSVKSLYGTGNDLEVYHDGTHAVVNNTTGNVYLSSLGAIFLRTNTNETSLLANANGNLELYYNNSKKFETSSTGVSVTGALSTTTDVTVGANATFLDNGKAIFGAGSDLQIYHNGTNQDKIESLSSFLILESSNLILRNNGGSEDYAKFFGNGGAELYYDNIKRLETLTDGAKVTGNLEVTGTITGAGGSFLPLIGGTMTGDTIHNDNVKSIYGTGSDLEIYHDGSNSRIVDNGTGELRLQGTNLRLWASNGENYLTAIEGGAVSLYFNAAKKIETISSGVTVTGDLFADGVIVGSNEFIKLGDGNQFTFVYDNTDAQIKTTAGDLRINQGAVTKSIVFKTSDANSLDTTALTISRNADASFGRDVTIAGDLTVNGTTTTVNSQTLAVVDPLIQLAKDNTANSLDIGLYGDYNDGTDRFLGLFSDASDSNKFKLFKGTTVEPTTTVNIGATGYESADLVVAGLESSSFISTGTVSATSFISTTDAGININGLTLTRVAANTAFRTSGGLETLGLLRSYAGLNVGTSAVIGSLTQGSTLSVLSVQGGTNTTQTAAGNGGVFNKYVSGDDGIIGYIGTGSHLSNPVVNNNDFAIRSQNDLIFNIGSSTKVRIDSTGKSTFAGDVEIRSGNKLILQRPNNGVATEISTDSTGAMILNSINDEGFFFNNNGTNAFKLDPINATFAGDVIVNGGNVKIKKSVASNETMLGLEQSGAGTTILGSITYDQSDDAMRLLNNSDFGGTSLILGTRGQDIFKIDYSGNSTFVGDVGIGVGADNPVKTLDVRGSLAISNSTASYWYIDRNDATGNFDLNENINGTLFSVTTNGLGSFVNTSIGDKLLLAGDDAASARGLMFNCSTTTNQGDTWDIDAQSSTGIIKFSTGSTPRMTIDSSGNIGIGAAPLQSKLDILNNGDYDSHTGHGLAINSNASNAYTSMYMGADDSVDAAYIQSAGRNTSFTSKKLLLNPNGGNVGIGTDLPSYPLDITGAIRSSSGLYLNNASGGFLWNQANAHIAFGTNNTEKMRITAQGELQYTGNGVIRNEISDGNYSYWFQSASEVRFAAQYAQPLTFYNNGAERMRIDSSGQAIFYGDVTLDSDSTKLKIGDSQDLQLYHDGSHSFIDNNTGNLYLRNTSSGDIILRNSTGGDIQFDNEAATNILFNTSNIERMRIASDGTASLGNTSPESGVALTVRRPNDLGNNVGNYQILAAFQNSVTNFNQLYINSVRDANGTDWTTQGMRLSMKVDSTWMGYMQFNGSGNGSGISFGTGTSTSAPGSVTERMRITSGGRVLINTQTTTPESSVVSAVFGSGGDVTLKLGGYGGSTHTQMQFFHNATVVGSVVTTASSTSYNTSSDYRLKEDLQDFAGLDMVSKIPVYDFKWKTDESRSYGVMAHELQDVLPDAVTGEKDAEEIQSVDYSKIVPLLVKSIQELKAEVDSLKQKCNCKN